MNPDPHALCGKRSRLRHQIVLSKAWEFALHAHQPANLPTYRNPKAEPPYGPRKLCKFLVQVAHTTQWSGRKSWKRGKAKLVRVCVWEPESKSKSKLKLKMQLKTKPKQDTERNFLYFFDLFKKWHTIKIIFPLFQSKYIYIFIYIYIFNSSSALIWK